VKGEKANARSAKGFSYASHLCGTFVSSALKGILRALRVFVVTPFTTRRRRTVSSGSAARITSPITAMPCAPARRQEAALSASMPPSAMIPASAGTPREARRAAASASRPTAGRNRLAGAEENRAQRHVIGPPPRAARRPLAEYAPRPRSAPGAAAAAPPPDRRRPADARRRRRPQRRKRCLHGAVTVAPKRCPSRASARSKSRRSAAGRSFSRRLNQRHPPRNAASAIAISGRRAWPRVGDDEEGRRGEIHFTACQLFHAVRVPGDPVRRAEPRAAWDADGPGFCKVRHVNDAVCCRSAFV